MRKVFDTLSRARRKFQKNRHPCWTSARRRGNEEWQHHHWEAVDAVRNCKKREYTSVARRWPHEALYRNTQTYLGWSLEYCPFLDHLKTIQITCNATQGERLRYRNDFMLQWENPTNPGIMSIHEKFRDAVKTTYNDGSSRTRVHLHPSTGKDLTTSHWLATTLSTPRRVQTMESCPWNSGAIVIVFVNDLVEFATLGKSSTVARVANEPQLGKSQLCQTRGQDSRNSRYWVRNLFQGFCGAWQGSKQQPDQIICDLRFGLACRKQSKTKKSKNALSRRQKLDNARKLTGKNFIDPEDEESEESLKTKQERNSKLLWNRLCLARWRQESVWGATGNCAHESTRKRLESTLPRNHEDHTAERERVQFSHSLQCGA